MPNLVGIGNSQVPTNAMLGGLAYQDPAHANLTNVEIENIAEIKQDIQLTAYTTSGAVPPNQVFVYDTRKDSDGGAWRKRCQGTSWYNEPPSSFRGHRREFPSVAVIVVDTPAGAGRCRIFDADDPNMPLWMEFTPPSSNRNVMYGTGRAGCVHALNGIMIIGSQASNFWPVAVDFLADDIIGLRSSGGHYSYYGQGGTGSILQRNNATNSSSEFWTNVGTTKRWWINGSIAGNHVLDICMTVRSSNGINPTTGMIKPDIYLATHAGVCVIVGTQRSGTSMFSNTYVGNSSSGSSYSYSNQVTITDEEFLWWTGDSYNSYASFRDSFAMHLNFWDNLTGNFTWSNSGDNISIGGECINYYAITTGAEAGDLKIGNSSNWAWTRQRRNALAGAAGLAFHKPPNRRYKDPESANFLNNHQNERSMIAMITSSENTGWFSPATAISAAYLCNTSTADIGSSTDIPDYGGPNARTIPVTGTLTKEKVATGAEMACASGWSSSNYALLSGANLNLGNPIHITLSGWIKLTDISDYSYLVSIADFTNTDAKCGIAIAETGSGNDGKAYFYSAGHTSVYSDITLNDGHWHHVVGVLDSGGNKKSIYVDGIQYGTTSPSNKNYGDVDYISIGSYAGGSAGSLTYHCRGALAMIKLMGSSLTDEQVRHMYRDERALFYDDAACTLYGSSNATTGLAYDEGTGLYHVGTSAGRSDFRGLQRINNTTTAVVSSISASNGLIAEY